MVFKNWKTTFSGIAALLFAGLKVYHDVQTNKPVDIPEAITSISVGIGLITAKDKNVTGGTTPQSGGTVAADPAARAESKAN